jgi:hypothetical protein
MVVAALLSVFIGIALGLLGGGGSILTVPVLVYAVGLGAKEAVATSLVVVGLTALVGAARHLRAGTVRLDVALVFGSASMLGAFYGGKLAQFVSPTVLLVAFAALMIATAVAMLRSKSSHVPDASAGGWRKAALIGLEGLLVGGVTGLVGAGGGFLIVPALVMLGGLDMRAAVGTSLVIITMKSATGFMGHMSHVSLDVPLLVVVTSASVAGTLFASRLASKMPEALLRRGFAWFVLAMAAFILHSEGLFARGAETLGPAPFALVLLLAAFLGATAWLRRLRQA